MSDNEENIQDQLHLKQELLKEEIVAKNYDGQKFLEYCMSLKENGDDMNNWKLDELKSVVENFKAEYEEKKEKEKIQEKKETPKYKSPIMKIIKKEENQKIQEKFAEKNIKQK